VSLNIYLKEFGSKKEIEVRFNEEFEPFEFRGDHVEFAEKVSVEGRLRKLKSGYHLKSKVLTTLVLTCSRCLDRFAFNVNVPLKVIYTNRLLRNEPKEKCMDKRDVALSYYSGDEIQIDDDVMGAIVLSIPMKPLCREDCKGLCPVCGANLNYEKCTCKTEQVDPRLEKLKLLLQKEVV